jgi:hypothetical protein
VNCPCLRYLLGGACWRSNARAAHCMLVAVRSLKSPQLILRAARLDSLSPGSAGLLVGEIPVLKLFAWRCLLALKCPCSTLYVDRCAKSEAPQLILHFDLMHSAQAQPACLLVNCPR